MVTLTPRTATRSPDSAPPSPTWLPIVRARSQVIYGNRNWLPNQISGTTPSYLVVRDWDDFTEGQMFTDRDVLNESKVCVVGETIKRELFQGESPIGKEVRINNVSFRVIGVLAPKGANMMGQDQDDIVLAPWTTIKYRVSGSSIRTSTRARRRRQHDDGQGQHLHNIYPGCTSPYHTQSATEATDTPQPVRFPNVDQILVKAGSPRRSPRPYRDHQPDARAASRRRRTRPDDFNIRDMTEVTNAMSSQLGGDGHPAGGGGHDLPGRRRRGDHEHHARLRHRADAGDRPADGGRCPEPPHPAAVPGRGGRAMPGWRGLGNLVGRMFSIMVRLGSIGPPRSRFR